jgi:shikimate kinase
MIGLTIPEKIAIDDRENGRNQGQGQNQQERVGMNEFLRGINLYLIGMPGCGKSTLGRVLAERLGYQFFDTDQMIEQLTQQTVAQVFADQGEAQFRNLETQVLGQLSAYTRLAIATGGGIVLRQQNWSYLRHGAILWLDVPLAQLQQRLHADTSRPLLQTADLSSRLHTLWHDRQALYAQADVRLTCQVDESVEQLGDRAIAALQTVVKTQQLTEG